MPARVNLRLLERTPQHLEGQLPPGEFAEGFRDELLTLDQPVDYSLDVTRQPAGLLVTGSLGVNVNARCSRCLQPFTVPVDVPGVEWLVPLEGEEAPPRDGDFVDLTQLIREDTFLALPTNPLCRPDCRGLAPGASARDSRLGESPGNEASPWNALDKLKL